MPEPAHITRLAGQAAVIHRLCVDVTTPQARWRPHADAWSLLEVINHLADEEREDFRTRLDYLLHRPGEPWPPIDPAAWVRARDYNQREPTPSLARFTAAREESLRWLRGLALPDLDVAAVAPWGGPLRAGDLLAAWVAHDWLHIRQLVELHYAWTRRQQQPYRADYAGDW